MANKTNDFPEILTNARFYIELKLDGSQEPVDAYFMECTGIQRSQEAIEVQEVIPRRGKKEIGNVLNTKIPGNLKTNNITLRRGMTQSIAFSQWFESVERGNWAQQIRDGSITIYNQAAEAQAVFLFRGAWPVRYSISDLNANGTDVEIEEIELAVERFYRQRK
jgi:phage tail-like protein